MGVINNHLERHSLLYRSDAWKQKLIAANVTQLVLVVATEPSFSDELLSRCICAAESEDIASLIVLNKTDLHNRLAAAREALACFSSLGYDILELSAHADVEAFRGRLLGHCSVLVGQSGMGKSTLTNALVPEAKAATRRSRNPSTAANTPLPLPACTVWTKAASSSIVRACRPLVWRTSTKGNC